MQNAGRVVGVDAASLTACSLQIRSYDSFYLRAEYFVHLISHRHEYTAIHR